MHLEERSQKKKQREEELLVKRKKWPEPERKAEQETASLVGLEAAKTKRKATSKRNLRDSKESLR